MRRATAFQLLLAAALACAAEPPEPCCNDGEPEAADPHAAHRANPAAFELPPGAYTAGSLYQIETTYQDDSGGVYLLGELRGQPVVLTMFFASCSYACPMLVADMTRIRDALPEQMRASVKLVLVSFDSERDTSDALRRFRAERGLDSSWVLLRGSDDSVRELAAVLGVKYRKEADGQFAHSNLISILNGEGEIVHQRAGLKGGFEEAAGALAAAVD